MNMDFSPSYFSLYSFVKFNPRNKSFYISFSLNHFFWVQYFYNSTNKLRRSPHNSSFDLNSSFHLFIFKLDCVTCCTWSFEMIIIFIWDYHTLIQKGWQMKRDLTLSEKITNLVERKLSIQTPKVEDKKKFFKTIFFRKKEEYSQFAKKVSAWFLTTPLLKWKWMMRKLFRPKFKTIEVPEIIYEGNSKILIEYNEQSCWLKKSQITINRDNKISITMPGRLYKKIFNSIVDE